MELGARRLPQDGENSKMQADYNGALVIPNNNYFANRNGLKPKYIILHGTAGGTNAEAIANYFASTQNTDNPVSSHYVIGVDGEVVQCVSESDGAYANGAFSAGYASWWDTSVNPNLTTISIEHCKPSLDNSDTLTPAQQESSFKLIKDIATRWHIPCKGADSSGGITGHFSIDPVNRSNCPGSYNWDALWSYLNQNQEEEMVVIDLSQSQVAQYFESASGNAWKCKSTKCVIGGAILAFYQRFGNAAFCGLTYLGLPVTSEIGIPGYQGVTKQYFERGVLVYDPHHQLDRPPAAGDVYLAHLYSGVGQDPRLAQVQGQLAQANAQIKALQGSAQMEQVKDLQGKLQQINQLSKV